MNMPSMKPVLISTKGKSWWERFLLVFARRKWELSEDWHYKLPNGTPIIIQKGFIFDGASVPRVFWWLPGLSPTGILFIPGLIHDFAYANRSLRMPLKDTLVKYGYLEKRRYWDKLFRQVGTAVNGVYLIDWVAWFCLLIGGWHAWRSHRREEDG